MRLSSSAEGDLVAPAFGTNQVLGRMRQLSKLICAVAAVLAQLVFEPRHHIAKQAPGRRSVLLLRALVGHGDDDGHMAVLPLVMNCLTPLITYSSPRLTAVVRRAEALEPTCGSSGRTRPASATRQGREPVGVFCCALPKCAIGWR